MKQLITCISLLLSLLGPGLALAANSEAGNLRVVPTEEVCMVTNAHFGRKQIPVLVEKKTYYGCCENCKATLNNDTSARIATEALTGKKIDKAKAVIAARPDGSVLYFENLTNFKKFASSEK